MRPLSHSFDISPAHNSTYPKGGVSCSKDSLVVNQTFVFQIKFCGKSPALRVAAKRYKQGEVNLPYNNFTTEAKTFFVLKSNLIISNRINQYLRFSNHNRIFAYHIVSK